MNVASLELSKELYELSGWSGTTMHHLKFVSKHWKVRVKPLSVSGIQERYPAYDVGYLLRKLPPTAKIQRISNINYIAALGDVSVKNKNFATTPEDAAAKLCVELFKQGVLTKEADHDQPDR